MTAKATKKAPVKDATTQDKPKKKKAAAATAPENRAHHATLSETKCSDCAVGLLKQFASESLRNQKKLDPGNQRFHLQDDEELELLRTNPLTLQLVGLRRERSLSNRFDDLLVVLYDPALLKEGEKTVLEAEGLRAENLKDAQAYVDAVLAETKWPAPKDWPLPGVDVSCPQCKHWRVAVLPITTEPGYDKNKPSLKDDKGNKLPDFDNHTLIEDGVGAIAPGIYNAHYRVGLHKGSRNPPTSYAALQFAALSIPVRRRYPIADFLNSAQAAYDSAQDETLCAKFAKEDAEAQKEARAKLEQELGEKMPRKTAKERMAFTKAVDRALTARNLEVYKPRIAEHRKQQALAMLDLLVNGSAKKTKKIDAAERFIRLEDSSGAETQDFEAEGNQVSHLEVLEDDESPMKVGLQLVFKSPPPPPAQSSAAATVPMAPLPTTAPGLPTEPAPPPPPRTLRLTERDVLVTLGTAGGTNIHRSEDGEKGAWRRVREVNDWSEGCQVFRSPHDFRDFMRMAMLSKRALCSSRQASCCEKLTVEDVEKAIGQMMTKVLAGCPSDFAEPARDAITAAFTPPPPPSPPTESTPEPEATVSPIVPDPKAVTPPPAPDLRFMAAVEKLLDERISSKDFDKEVREAFFKVFPNKQYDSAGNFTLLKSYTREKVLAVLLPEEQVKKAVEGAPQAPKEARAFEKELEKTFKKAIETGLENLRTKLTETKDAWVTKQHERQIRDRHKEYLSDGLEPCDFGACSFRFDYMLAETTRSNMEAFVSKLGGRDWNALFPEDAPPPPPKPKKQASSKSTGKKGKPPSPSASAPK